MNTVVVGVGGHACSSSKDDVLKTYALGSCVAVILVDVQHRVAGMIHVALPDSKIDPVKAVELPGYFADTGINALVKSLQTMAPGATARQFVVKLAGGAQILDPNSTFNIGKRNVIAIRKRLWRAGLGAQAAGGSSGPPPSGTGTSDPHDAPRHAGQRHHRR